MNLPIKRTVRGPSVRPDHVWRVHPPSSAAPRLAGETGITLLQAQLLINRGVSDRAGADAFLSPSLSRMLDPFRMKGMEAGVRKIVAAVEGRKKIAIYGDYDADGLTATALLFHFFSDLGVPVSAYIPNRLEEGYGLHGEAIERLRQNGTDLLITVDCGISAENEVALARKEGLDVVVTDHHQPRGDVTPPCPVINPHQEDCPFPFKHLSGVGLAFYLTVALRSAFRGKGWFNGRREPDLREYLDLAALGTVADRVPLSGENRLLVAAGMRRIGRSRWPGMRALMEAAGVNRSPLTSDDLAFKLAPRLNAPGRLGDSESGLDILMTSDDGRARALAGILSSANTRRQGLEQGILDRIEEVIQREDLVANRKILLLWGANWHPGVLGIVAARLVDRYHRPSLVAGTRDGLAMGSGRSITGFHLFRALSRLSPLFDRFGGHAHAAGFRLGEGNLGELKRELEEIADDTLSDQDLIPVIHADAQVSLKDVDREMIRAMAALAPFGEGNPEPVFLARSVTVLTSRVVGDRHLKLRLRQGETVHEAIGFNLGAHHPLQGEQVDILFTPELNQWQGSETIQLRLADLRRTADVIP